jgi:hypothetical protein
MTATSSMSPVGPLVVAHDDHVVLVRPEIERVARDPHAARKSHGPTPPRLPGRTLGHAGIAWLRAARLDRGSQPGEAFLDPILLAITRSFAAKPGSRVMIAVNVVQGGWPQWLLPATTNGSAY